MYSTCIQAQWSLVYIFIKWWPIFNKYECSMDQELSGVYSELVMSQVRGRLMPNAAALARPVGCIMHAYVAASAAGTVYIQTRYIRRLHPFVSVNEYRLRLGRSKAGMSDAAWCALGAWYLSGWAPLRWQCLYFGRYNKCSPLPLPL